jgi:hypothetical protein
VPTNDPEPDAHRDSGVLASWGAVLRDVRSLAVDLTKASAEMARQVPIPSVPGLSGLPSMPQFSEIASGRARVEEMILREIRSRLNGPDPAGAGTTTSTDPVELLKNLLEASIDADTASSRAELYSALLRQLVPDEARILAALSDGTVYPLIHVQSRAGNGGQLLSNMSSVGRAAGVQLPDAVNTYVLHLRNLGLAEEGPPDDSLTVQYDILLGEPGVREAEQEARTTGRLGAKVVRRTLRISALGRELWRACRPEDPIDPSADPSDQAQHSHSARNGVALPR